MTNALDRVVNSLTRSGGDLLAELTSDERDIIVLSDTSSSMNSGTDSEQRKIDALRTVHHNLRGMGYRFRNIVFGDTVEMREDIPEPGGSTPLREAIEMASTFKPGRLVVISDGAPDDGPGALRAAQALGVPIETFYVGPRPSAGEGFLAQLANATGGNAHVGDLGKGMKALEAEVKAVLAIGDGTEQRVIRL